MYRFILSSAAAVVLLAHAPASRAQETPFQKGPMITEFGPVAAIDADFQIPKRAKFKVLFDAAKPAEPNAENRTLTTAARFLNMHAAAGVPAKNLKAAVVVHGKASFDLTTEAKFASYAKGRENKTAALIEDLLASRVRIILCGQSAAYHGISKEDLLPGVEVALSAMTAHALLQQKGYTLNPF